MDIMEDENFCLTCEFREECEKHYGAFREDGDDFTALKGTHYCAYSWKDFK